MKKNNPIKKIILCTMYAIILFLQEQVLSFVPNFQFSFLIIITIGAVVGLKWGSLIVIFHVIVDNLIWGLVVPHLIIPMMIGYEITLLFGYLTRNAKLEIVIIFGILASLVYCWLFIPFNVIFLKIGFLTYLLADILFELILVISTILTILWFYRPLKKLIEVQWESTFN